MWLARSVIPRVRHTRAALGGIAGALIALLECDGSRVANGFPELVAPSVIWTVPEIGALPNDAHDRLVRSGRDLITATFAHIGPEVPDRTKRFAGNNLACGNCHADREFKGFKGSRSDYPILVGEMNWAS